MCAQAYAQTCAQACVCTGRCSARDAVAAAAAPPAAAAAVQQRTPARRRPPPPPPPLHCDPPVPQTQRRRRIPIRLLPPFLILHRPRDEKEVPVSPRGRPPRRPGLPAAATSVAKSYPPPTSGVSHSVHQGGQPLAPYTWAPPHRPRLRRPQQPPYLRDPLFRLHLPRSSRRRSLLRRRPRLP